MIIYQNQKPCYLVSVSRWHSQETLNSGPRGKKKYLNVINPPFAPPQIRDLQIKNLHIDQVLQDRRKSAIIQQDLEIKKSVLIQFWSATT